jgi:hypothetical protein
MPRLVIHAAFEVHPDYIEECKTLFKEVTRESLAEVGTEYYVCECSIFFSIDFDDCNPAPSIILFPTLAEMTDHAHILLS